MLPDLRITRSRRLGRRTRPSGTCGPPEPSRRYPAGSAASRPPGTGTPSAATSTPAASTAPAPSPQSATPSPATPGCHPSPTRR